MLFPPHSFPSPRLVRHYPRPAAKWVRRYRQLGRAGLKDLSSRPHHSPRQTPSTLLERVFALRQLRWNGWRIARELHLSHSTISCVLRRAGMNRLRSLDPPPPVVRHEHKRPGELIHFDIKRLARFRKPDHRIFGKQSRRAGWEYLHLAIDDHSRISFAAMLPDQSHRPSIRFFLLAGAHFNRLCYHHSPRLQR